jgi:hypothetical protein
MNNQHSSIDNLLNDSLGKNNLLSPSEHFTLNTIKKIEILAAKEKQLHYEPLVSKHGWFIIMGVFIAIFVYGIFSTPKYILPAKFRLTHFFEFLSTGLGQWSISPVLVWGFAAISLLFMLISLFYANQYQPRQ